MLSRFKVYLVISTFVSLTIVFSFFVSREDLTDLTSYDKPTRKTAIDPFEEKIKQLAVPDPAYLTQQLFTTTNKKLKNKINKDLKQAAKRLDSILDEIGLVVRNEITDQEQLSTLTGELTNIKETIVGELRDSQYSSEFIKSVDGRFESLNNSILSLHNAHSAIAVNIAKDSVLSQLDSVESARKVTQLHETPNFRMLSEESDMIELPKAKSPPKYSSPQNYNVQSFSSASCESLPADLESALPEVDITAPEIVQLAKELEHSPIQIYEWVKNNIKTEFYYGSIRSATSTLNAKIGNDTDQSALLIALLRASGYPANFVKGKIKFAANDERIFSWFGADDLSQISLFVRYLGRSSYVDANTFNMDHVWVQACIPYDDYRGAGKSEIGNRWIPLSPSFKQRERKQGITIPTHFPDFEFDYGSYLAGLTPLLAHEALVEQLGTDADRIGLWGGIKQESFDVIPITLPFEVHTHYDWTQDDGTEVSQVAAIPSEHKYTVKLKFKHDFQHSVYPDYKQLILDKFGTTVEHYESPEIPISKVIQKDFVLKFGTFTQDIVLGQQMTGMGKRLANFQSACDHVEPYSGSTKAFLALHGEADSEHEVIGLIPTSEPIDYLEDNSQQILESPCRANWDVTLTVYKMKEKGGAKYNEVKFVGMSVLDDNVFTIDGLVSDEEISGKYQEIVEFVAKNPDAEAILEESRENESKDIRSRFLRLVGLNYYKLVNSASNVIANAYGEIRQGGMSILRTGSQVEFEYIFDLPFGIAGTRLFIDAPGMREAFVDAVREEDIGTSQPVNNSEESSVNHIFNSTDFESFLLRGVASSAFESYVWQESAYVDAISTVRGLQFSSQGDGHGYVVLEAIEGGNRDAHIQLIVNALDVECGVIDYSASEISSLANKMGTAGSKFSILVLPKCKTLYADWYGFVYIGHSGANGASGFILQQSNTTSGGAQASPPVTDLTFNSTFDFGMQTQWDESTSLFSDTSDFFDFGSISIFDGIDGALTGASDMFSSFAGDPVNLNSGNLYEEYNDLSLKGPGGLNTVFARYYNSFLRVDGPLGYGWTHSFAHKLVFKDSESEEDTDTVTDTVAWVDGKGQNHYFDIVRTQDQINSNIPIGVSNSFVDQGNTYVTLQRETNGEYSITERNGLSYFFESKDGNRDDEAKLLRIVDRNANAITLGYSSGKLNTISNDAGQRLTLHYENNDNHITKVEDQTGRFVKYEYTGDTLTKVKSPLANDGKIEATSYTYYSATDGTNLAYALKSFTKPTGESMEFQYYTNGKVFRHVNNFGDSYTFFYNVFRRETTTVDESGHKQTYLFNKHGQQTKHFIASDNPLLYEYENDSHPLLKTSNKNALGLEYQNEYDSKGNLTTKTQPDGTTFDYFDHNEFHLAEKIKNPNGNYTLNRFDTSGNQTDLIVLKAGVNTDSPTAAQIVSWTKFEHDSKGNLTKTQWLDDFTKNTPPYSGPYVEYVYDDQRIYIKTVRQCGTQYGDDETTSYKCLEAEQEADDLGRITKALSSNFYFDHYQYDSNSRVIASTNFDGSWANYQYDGNGNLTNKSLVGQKQDGTVGFLINDSIVYDELNRPIQTSNLAGFSQHHEYDEVGRLVKATNPDGYTVSFEYDQLGNVSKAYDEQGNAVKTEFDRGSRPISVTSATGDVTRYFYYGSSENGRLQRVEYPNSTSINYQYDNSGNVVKTVDNAGNERLTNYDELNRVVRTVGPVHNTLNDEGAQLINVRQVLKYVYNALGHQTSISAGYTNHTGSEAGDILKVQATYTYDDFGRMITKTDALNKTTSYRFDRHGNLLELARPNGSSIAYTYDHARKGLLTRTVAKKSTTDSTPEVIAYTYNDLGQLKSVTSNAVTYSYQYDSANRLNGVTDSRANKSLTQNYSPAGKLNWISDSEGKKVVYLYDGSGRITSIQGQGGETVIFAYDGNGRLAEKLYANGVSSKYAYDNNTRLESVVNSLNFGLELVSSHSYEYDELGRKSSITNRINNVTTVEGFHYDNIGRLIQIDDVENGTSTLQQRFSYDQFSNRKKLDMAGQASLFFNYDAAQQLANIRNTSFTGPIQTSYNYDAVGNLIQRTQNGITSQFNHNGLNQLVEFTQSGQSIEQYRYDHSGRRVSKISGGVTNNYLYAGDSIWSEYSANWQQAQAHYTYSGLDRPISRTALNAQESRYFHSDGMGSVVAQTDTTGTSMASQSFDAWGNVKTATGTINLYGYTGRESDASGLTYYRARYYDQSLGRFTQRDPLGFYDGINPYVYVGNSPVNYSDPSGMVADTFNHGWESASNYAGVGYQYGSAIATGIAQGFVPTGEDMTLMTGGLGAAAADGPLPFGEVLLGGATLNYLGKSVGRSVDNVNEAFGNINLGIQTPWGTANQGYDVTSLSARLDVNEGATLYRLGTTGRSEAANAQFWALENPLNAGYAGRYGIPEENIVNANFIETATLKPNTPFVTRPAPGIGDNIGGGIEVVVPENGVNMQTFSLGGG